ncbi:hypothetical protein [Solibacillus sp. R5-41]|nr:hypothetical protein [Solibacillus sp. R5-41]
MRVHTFVFKEANQMVFLMSIAVGITTIAGLIMFAETSEETD